MIKNQYLDPCPAFIAEFGTGRKFGAAIGAFGRRFGHRRAAVIAEFDTLSVLLSAVFAAVERKGSSAVVAEFTRSGRLSADRAYGRFAFDLIIPDCSRLGLFVYVAAHCVRAGLGYIYFLTGSAFNAEALILIMVRVAYPLMAGMAPVEMAAGFILSLLKCRLVLLLPLRAPVFKSLGQNISAPLHRIADIAHPSSEKASEHTGSAGQAADILALFICGGFYEAAFKTVVAYVAIKCKLKSCLC